MRYTFHYGIVPDMYDLLGGMIALVGVGIMMYAPR
ncbi:hypothetical protein [Sulfurospirillum sp. hDNRA2]|nr:hypothetical protein [Sulfurospirillum sp. DNRA8]MCP3652749.1 hypothetical protein [Sulfurospirillum sp. DNRA8]MCR1811601.1 hypothetical protein [Sulfurospirillum sp. DNRA8]